MKNIPTLIIAVLLSINSLYPQIPTKSYGFIIGQGGQNLSQFLGNNISSYLNDKGINPENINILVNYYYKVWFFQFQYYKKFSQKKSVSYEVLIQPQINFSYYRKIDTIAEYSKGFETGINTGLLIRKNFSKKFNVYLLLSIGPHYVSGTPQRQAKGFIFSDNIFIGANIKLKNNIYLDIRPGFRHISNAGIKRPNGGVNTAILSFGFRLL